MARRYVCACVLGGVAAVTGASPAWADDAQASVSVSTSTSGAAPAPADTTRHPAPNSVYAEGLGAGLIYSINYERMVTDDIGVRAGFGYVSVSASASDGTSSSSASASFVTIPVTASYTGLRTSGGAGLEAGAGATVLYVSASANAIGTSSSGAGVLPLGVALVGFRLHPMDHPGFQFRIGAMALGGPGLGLSNATAGSFGFIPWAYLSLGASF